MTWLVFVTYALWACLFFVIGWKMRGIYEGYDRSKETDFKTLNRIKR